MTAVAARLASLHRRLDPADPEGPAGPRSAESGITLVEMVVALFLAAMIMGSFVGVAIAGAGASRAADLRARANQLGNQELENLKAIPWTSLGLYDNDAASCGSETVVSLGATAPSPRAPAPQYSRTVSLDKPAHSFTVTDCVTWYDNPADGLASAGTETDSDGGHDEKHLVVSVSWTVLNKLRTVTFDAMRAPTAVEVPPVTHTTATLALTPSTPSPASQQLAADYSLTQPMTLGVTASLAASSMQVVYAGRSGTVTSAMTTTDGGTVWSLVVPATSGGSFNPGTTTFTFKATSGSGSAQATTTATFTAPPTPFTLVTSATPNSVVLDSSYYLSAPLTLTVTSSTAASSVTVSYPTANGTGTGVLVDQGGGTSWKLVLAADHTTGPYAATTNELFTFSATAPSGSTSGSTSVTLTAPAPPTMKVTSIVVQGYTSGSICVDSNASNAGHTRAAQNVQITISNIAASDLVKLSWTAPNGGPVTAGTGTLSGGNYVFTAVIPASTAFSGANGTTTTLSVVATRASDGTSATASSPATIETHKAITPCT